MKNILIAFILATSLCNLGYAEEHHQTTAENPTNTAVAPHTPASDVPLPPPPPHANYASYPTHKHVAL